MLVRVKYWEIIADNLSKAGWSWGCVSAIDSKGRTIWIADAHRGDGKRFIVRADDKLTAFLELLPARDSRWKRRTRPDRLRSYRLPLGIYLKLDNLNPGLGQERLFLSVLSSSLSDPWSQGQSPREVKGNYQMKKARKVSAVFLGLGGVCWP